MKTAIAVALASLGIASSAQAATTIGTGYIDNHGDMVSNHYAGSRVCLRLRGRSIATDLSRDQYLYAARVVMGGARVYPRWTRQRTLQVFGPTYGPSWYGPVTFNGISFANYGETSVTICARIGNLNHAAR